MVFYSVKFNREILVVVYQDYCNAVVLPIYRYIYGVVDLNIDNYSYCAIAIKS